MLTDAIDLTALQRTLVIKLRHHGDVLLTSPLCSVLKNHAPHVEIDALVYRDTQDMLTLHPALENVFTIDRDWKNLNPMQRLGAEINLLKTLKQRNYDLVIHLTEHPRGAWLARLLGIRHSVARAYERRGAWWRRSFTHLYPAPHKPRHTVEIHLDALRRLGIYPSIDERRLVLIAGAHAEDFVSDVLAQHGLTAGGYLHLHPTSRWSFKCWTIANYAELINRLHSAGERVVITAAPDQKEMAMIDAIKEKLHQPAVDLAGRLNLKQLAALTARAKCFIGVDSAPMHIAAAMQTPTVALFGPSGDQEWGPWQVRHKVIAENYSCRPCGLDGCGGGKVSECLTTIPVARVFDAVKEIAAL
ncbi:MAG: putative lipopolysaccharide heptosyltransferase III [Pseudomonadota bacterium]